MADIYSMRIKGGAAKGYPQFRNDHAASEVHIGSKVFECIGVTPPDDHPHVYLDMGAGETIICPYCATLFAYDAKLRPTQAEPADCAFIEHDHAA